MDLNRRRFLQLSAGAAAASHLHAGSGSLSAALHAPGYDQVQLTGGIPLQQQGVARAVLASFDPDALLKPFRAMAGLPAPGRDLGGWYQYLPTYDYRTGDAGFAPGHSFGQWTAAMARFAAADRDASAGERVLQLHAGLAGCISPDFFDLTRFPAYTLDKLLLGLLDAHTLLASPTALAAADKVRQCAVPSLPGAAQDRDTASRWRKDRDISFGWDESYTLPEHLYRLYDAGAGSAFLSMARAYRLDSFFAALAADRNVLGGLHGYSHVNALSSALAAFCAEGDSMYFRAAQNGFRMLEAQTLATGGWAPDETLEKPGSSRLLASLDTTHNSFETPCGTHAMMKLCRALLQLTRDGSYGDCMERVVLNSMLGALPLQDDGRTFYYADLNRRATRVYSAHRWPCCSGTYPLVAADYGVYSYSLGPAPPGDVWVNLYLPSTLRWRTENAACTLTQSGLLSGEDRVHLRLTASRPARFRVLLRLPAWARTPSVRVGGVPVPIHRQQGFAILDREWDRDTRIELHLPATLRLEPFPADGGAQAPLAALCYGPWVLMATSASPQATPDRLLAAERVGPLTWRSRGSSGELSFVPFFAVGDRTYSAYVRVT